MNIHFFSFFTCRRNFAVSPLKIIDNWIRSKLKYAITGSINTMESRRSNSGNWIRSKLKYAITGSINTMESRRSNSGVPHLSNEWLIISIISSWFVGKQDLKFFSYVINVSLETTCLVTSCLDVSLIYDRNGEFIWNHVTRLWHHPKVASTMLNWSALILAQLQGSVHPPPPPPPIFSFKKWKLQDWFFNCKKIMRNSADPRKILMPDYYF